MNAHSKFFLFFIALASAMGGFLFGYDWVVIGGAKNFSRLPIIRICRGGQ